MDRAVQSISFEALAGRSIYLDDTYLSSVTDRNYLVSTLRQHLLASGCILAKSRDEASYIVEARAGAVGTNSNQLLFGVPSINIPSFVPVPGVPSSIPEIPIVKKTDQRGVAKLALFAYHSETGAPVWQSGTSRDESTAKDTWILGAGPFQRGTIWEGTVFAGTQLKNPLDEQEADAEAAAIVRLDQRVTFEQPPARFDPGVIQASAVEATDQPQDGN